MSSSSNKFAFALFLCLLAFSLTAQSDFSNGLLMASSENSPAALNARPKPAAPLNAVATFPGGNEELLASIYETITYPEAALENAVEGMVVVRLHLDADGKVAEHKVVRGLGFGCDDVALEAIAALPRWIPARKAGRNAASIVYVPLKFSLR